MIHAFALEPELVATWGRYEEYRFILDKFGLGTPRVLLELPKFSTWKRAVYAAATALNLSQEDMKRIEELFRLFSEHKHRRTDTVYDGLLSWLENAETEYARRSYRGILTRQNPRNHEAVLVAEQLGPDSERWALTTGVSPTRTPEALALSLSAMLDNCRQLHLVDPHFGPEAPRYRKMLEALMEVIRAGGCALHVVRVHCSAKAELSFFEAEADRMAARLPNGLSLEFVRWRQKPGGDRLHNRYVLTEVGGVSLGVGLLLLPRPQYALRWSQYVEENGAFECVDRPKIVVGRRRPGAGGAR